MTERVHEPCRAQSRHYRATMESCITTQSYHENVLQFCIVDRTRSDTGSGILWIGKINIILFSHPFRLMDSNLQVSLWTANNSMKRGGTENSSHLYSPYYSSLIDHYIASSHTFMNWTETFWGPPSRPPLQHSLHSRSFNNELNLLKILASWTAVLLDLETVVRWRMLQWGLVVSGLHTYSYKQASAFLQTSAISKWGKFAGVLIEFTE